MLQACSPSDRLPMSLGSLLAALAGKSPGRKGKSCFWKWNRSPQGRDRGQGGDEKRAVHGASPSCKQGPARGALAVLRRRAEGWCNLLCSPWIRRRELRQEAANWRDAGMGSHVRGASNPTREPKCSQASALCRGERQEESCRQPRLSLASPPVPSSRRGTACTAGRSSPSSSGALGREQGACGGALYSLEALRKQPAAGSRSAGPSCAPTRSLRPCISAGPGVEHLSH